MITEEEIQNQNREIDLALARAAVRHRGKSAAEAVAASNQRARDAAPFVQDGRLVMRAPSPTAWLAEAAKKNLSRWPASREGAPDVGGAARARAALDVLANAIKILGTRDRAGTGAWIRDTHAAIAAALAAYEGFNCDLSGERAQELIAKITTLRAERVVAEQAFYLATPETVGQARAALDVVEAKDRRLGDEIVAAIDSMAFAALPDLTLFERAREATEALAKLPGKKPSATQIHAAYDLGRDASAAEAALWIIWEPAEPHALIAARWARYSER